MQSRVKHNSISFLSNITKVNTGKYAADQLKFRIFENSSLAVGYSPRNLTKGTDDKV